jgi:hypothetical protein
MSIALFPCFLPFDYSTGFLPFVLMTCFRFLAFYFFLPFDFLPCFPPLKALSPSEIASSLLIFETNVQVACTKVCTGDFSTKKACVSAQVVFRAKVDSAHKFE